MQYTIIALGVALAVLGMSLWWARNRSASQNGMEARCRRDIQALRRTSHARSPGFSADDVWSAGSEPDPAQSRGKKSVANLAIGTMSVSCGGGCGGCGCGCGG